MAASMGFSCPIVVDESTGVDRPGEVLLGGVPIERGALQQGGWFSLKAPGGGEFLVEGTPAAYWPDRSVKWLTLCGAADLAGGKRNEFVLAPSPARPQDRLQVSEVRSVTAGGKTLQISGGALTVELNTDAQNVLVVRRQGRAATITPGLSARLTFVGPDGGNRRGFPLSFGGSHPQVVVQTANRVVVRLSGQFPSGLGPEHLAGELILFVEVLADAAEVRIQPVFIYLGRPQEDLVAELSLTVHTAVCGYGGRRWREAKDQGLSDVQPLPSLTDLFYGFANQQGRGCWDVLQRVKADERGGDGPRWPQARQVQLGSSFYVTEKRTGEDSSWTKVLEGTRSQGWCCLGSPDSAVTAGMRQFWQEYPHSLGVDTDRGTITFGLVPPEAAPLDLRRYSQTIYGAAVYEASRGPFPGTHGATGIAKSFELMLRFDTTGPQDAPRRGLAFAQPCRPVVPPEQFARTRVIGHIAPPRPGRHEKAEKLMAEVADFLVRERDVRGWYGLMNYGDLMIAYYADLDRWAFDEGGYAWLNTEGLPDHGLWISALRCGRADWLDAAIAMTRHNRDVDMYHRGLLKGSGTRHNVNHWGCQDKEWRVTMPLVKRLHYYVTADPWTAEVIRQTVAVYQQHERTKKIAPNQTSPFIGILARWEMDGQEADERTLRNFADAVARAVREDGMFVNDLHVNFATGEGGPVGEDLFIAHFFMNTFGGQHALVEYAELAGHEALSEALVRHMRFYFADPKDLPKADHSHRGMGSVLPFLAHAYRRTGEQKYRDAIAKAIDKQKVLFAQAGGPGALEEPPHKVLPDFKRRNKVTCWLGGTILGLTPYGLAAME